MSININNGIANVLNTPLAYSDDFANAPAANAVPLGTLWFDYVNGAIYQSDHVSWKGISGGGTGTPGIDSVLAIGQLFGADRQIDCNGFSYSLQIKDAKAFTLNAYDIALTNSATNNFVNIGSTVEIGGTNHNLSFIVDDANYKIKSTFSGDDFGINITNDGITRVSQLGDLTSGTYNGTAFSIDDNYQTITTFNQGINNGFLFNFASKTIQLFYSDVSISSQLGIIIDSSKTVIMGDYGGSQYGTNITVDDANKRIEFNGDVEIIGGAHPNTNHHLKITVNGINYVIELKQP